ncbi:MAG TPA: L-seryl-tRNA(Sec) selenium transferase [Candidatus Sulfotelmatobacter sp.]|nr:L-seryl-tRNA(Sec) selenium transferase [Candidatus Sulfotelmatobacter sp.]
MATASSLRDLPSVDRLSRHPRLRRWGPGGAVATAARSILDTERARRRQDSSRPRDLDELATAVDAWLERRLHPGPHRVINATGVVIHTNLGRAPLSADARAAAEEASGYCDLEYDAASGKRGSRQEHIAPLLTSLTGAADAVVVGNNAAAVLLVLRALCHGREVLVSRGEAVEIGGGFRIPEVMRESGARMVDVGTTNRTRARDYETALTPRTVAIVRVHPSNFAITGFTERPSTSECADVAHRHGLILIEDAGSGALHDPAAIDRRLGDEPVLAQLIAAGADVVTASGDKLCGGPQAGLIVGRADLLAKVRRHPLMRALRPDKLVIAALAATLAGHLGGHAIAEVPVLRMLSRDLESLEATARQWQERLAAEGIHADVEQTDSAVGGGSLPGATLPTACLTLKCKPERMLAALRRGTPPVIARAAEGKVWLDPRTVSEEESAELINAVAAASRFALP